MTLSYFQMMLGSTSLAALLAAAPTAASAQAVPAPPAPTAQDSSAIDDIVVTAQRRSEKLQNVPIAITAINGDALATKGITTTQDIASVTPGLAFTTVTGVAAPRIRGIGTASALGGNENSVATYVDGVYYASSASGIFTLNNIAQVAVLKGPQGTLFGRNATGGLIQITTLDPKRDFGGEITGSYGNLNTIGGSLYVTGGLSSNLAADLSVQYNNQQDGFGRSVKSGADVNRQKTFSIRSKWMSDLGADTTIKFSGDYSSVRAVAPARRITYGSNPTGGTKFTAGPFDVFSDFDPSFVNDQGGGSVNFTHHFGGVDLVSITAYRKATTRIIFDIDALPAVLSSVDETFRDEQFSQELQLISTGTGPLSYTLGLYYFNASGGYLPATLITPPQIKISSTKQKAESPAAYAQATYKFDPATSLTLGFRYSSETREINGVGTVLTKATNVTTPLALSAKATAARPTWRVALDHRINSDVMIYASYNRGFKSGGFNSSNITVQEYFEPERLDAFEVGTKADLFGRHLRINASGFYYDYKNIQLTSFLQGQVRITNAASAQIYGLDMDVEARPTGNLTLSAGLSLIHDRFGTYTNAQVSTPNPAGGNVVASGVATGNRLPITPDWTLNLGFDYAVPISSGSLTLSAQYFHSDGWFAEPDNRLRQPSYDTVNASLKWMIGDDRRASITVWGRNLGNEVYDATLQTQNTGDVLVPANGRTFGATLGYKF